MFTSMTYNVVQWRSRDIYSWVSLVLMLTKGTNFLHTYLRPGLKSFLFDFSVNRRSILSQKVTCPKREKKFVSESNPDFFVFPLDLRLFSYYMPFNSARNSPVCFEM